MKHGTSTVVEGNAASLFQLDPVLSAQYLDTMRRKTSWQPEKKLMLAVLEEAIACFREHAFSKGKKGRSFREAQEWIFDPDTRWPFSFDNICQALELNPQYLRGGLIREKETGIETPKGKRPRSRNKGKKGRFQIAA